MALTTWYSAGTVSVNNGSAIVTGTGTLWGDEAIMPGDLFCDPAQPAVPPQRVKEVTADGTLELWAPWPGTTLTDAAYEIRYVGIIERSTAQTRRVLEQLGEVDAYFDVQVDELADRATYDDRPAGYRVLVSNTGDGRSAIYSKNSDTSADWSDPAYVTGPAVTLDVGSVTPVAFGEDPDVTLTPIGGGYEFDFELPATAAFEAGTITTLDPGEDATLSLSPVSGGYALNLGVPRGPTGDIDGVTSFWQGRITVDTTAAAARTGLGAVNIAGDVMTGPLVFLDSTNTAARIGSIGGITYIQAGGNNQGANPSSGAMRLTGISAEDLTSLTVRWEGAYRNIWHEGNLPVGSQIEWNAGTGTNPRALRPDHLPAAIAALMPSDVYRRSNILGAVAQSGGVPTGAIIERGSNSNGWFVRMADGTQICGFTDTASIVTTNAGGSVFYSPTKALTYPSSFTAVPEVSPSVVYAGTGSFAWLGLVSSKTSTDVSISAVGHNSSGTVFLSYIAIGRWF